MSKDRIMMPSGTAGITRYFDEYKSKLRFNPGHIIILAIAVALIIIFLHVYAGTFSGLA